MRTITPDMNWRLVGAGLVCEVAAPHTIDHALELAGLLPDRMSGMGALEREWAHNRAFALESVFTLDGWDCERTYLEFGYLMGSGRVLLNGELLGSFTGGAIVLDATAAAAPGVNELRVEFDPGRDRGVMGALRVRGCWSLHVREYMLEGCAGGIRARVRVSAHAAGRYVFSYAVSRGEAVVGSYSFEEKLGARCAVVSHELPVGAPEDYRADAPSATHVRLSVLRAGETCDERMGSVSGPMRAETRRTVAISGCECAQARLDMLLDMGVRRFIAAPDAYLPEEFLRHADECGAAVHAACVPSMPHACISGEQPDCALLRVAGMRSTDSPARPMPEIALRALGMEELLDAPQGALMSGLYDGDIARTGRILRYVQAHELARIAESAPETAFDLRGGYEAPVSPDLFDGDTPRPAYHMLRQAWRSRGAYALIGGMAFGAGEAVSVPIFAHEGVIRVRAELFTFNGRAVTRAEFTCSEGERVGEFMFTPDGNCGAHLLRLTAETADGTIVRDYPVCVRGMYALSALTALPTVRIKRVGDIYVNMDEAIAFGPVRADGGSALLPGESAALCCAGGVNVMTCGELA